MRQCSIEELQARLFHYWVKKGTGSYWLHIKKRGGWKALLPILGGNQAHRKSSAESDPDFIGSITKKVTNCNDALYETCAFGLQVKQ